MRLFAFLSFLLTAGASAQTDDIMLSPFWDFYAENRLSPAAGGRGYTGVASLGDVSATLLNPASLQVDSTWTFSFAYSYKSDLPWLKSLWTDVGPMYVQTLHPCLMAGVGHKRSDNFQFGLVYFDRHSLRLDNGESWATGPNGEDLGRYHCYDDVRNGVISVPFALFLAPALRLGLSVDVNYYRHDMHYRRSYSSTSWDVRPRMGFIAGSEKTLLLGLCYESPGKYHSTYVIPAYEGSADAEKHTINESPARFQLGMKFRFPGMRLHLLADLCKVWTSSMGYILKDRQDARLGLEYDAGGSVVRAGFFTQYDYRMGQYFALDPKAGTAHQYFLTAGVTTKGRLPITLSIMDSHILSRGEWKTTMVTVGFNYQR
jgi:hypothetical protein